MACTFIDCRAIAAQIRDEVKSGVQAFKDESGRAPRLGVVLANDNPASQSYVNKKAKLCEAVGIDCHVWDYRGDALDRRLGQSVKPNRSPKEYACDHARVMSDGYYDAIIVQLPVAGCKDQKWVYDLVPPGKDVDCFHPENVGLLSQGRPRFVPCTPAGILEILNRSAVPIEGRRVTVINDSDIVGKPLAMLMNREGATVTVCHDRTPPDTLRQVCRESDVVVVGVGKPGFLDRSFVTAGQTVIDVGISRVDGKIVGDVHPEVRELDVRLTPVPGGVGPLTCVMLTRNTLAAAWYGRN